jgi:hypothetical protein
VHPAIGEEIRAIGGGYSTASESTVEVDGREVLYSIVVACLDSSCCGEGGSLYANVVGYLIATEEADDGSAKKTSVVEVIDEPGERDRVARAIRKRVQVHEVRFWSPED